MFEGLISVSYPENLPACGFSFTVTVSRLQRTYRVRKGKHQILLSTLNCLQCNHLFFQLHF